jgi:hypothetical protein
MSLLHINAALQTARAGWIEMLFVRLFGKSRTEVSEADESGHVVLRKWRGRSYMWND